MNTTPLTSPGHDDFLPPVVHEAMIHLRRYAEGGLRCRWDDGNVEIVEYVPRREDALALLVQLEAALNGTPSPQLVAA